MSGMGEWTALIDDRGQHLGYRNRSTGEKITAKEFERRQMQESQSSYSQYQQPSYTHSGAGMPMGGGMPMPMGGGLPAMPSQSMPASPMYGSGMPQAPDLSGGLGGSMPPSHGQNPLIMPGAQMLQGAAPLPTAGQPHAAAQQAMPLAQQSMPTAQPGAPMTGFNGSQIPVNPGQGLSPTAGMPIQGKSLRMEGNPHHTNTNSIGYRSHGFLDATSVAILLPTLVLLALIIAAAHKKRLFPWQTIRTFNPPSGLMNPRDYERSFLCPPNLRRHGRLGKRNPNATWTEADGVVIPFGFLARTHLPITIPLGRLPNKNMFLVAPSGSGKTTLMRAIIKALLAKPCVIIALEAKANDPNLDEKKEGFKYSLLPEAQHAGFDTLYFNPLDVDSVHWNPLDLDAITFASSIVQDINSLDAEEQHWAERDMGYIEGLVQLLKWGAVSVSSEDENGVVSEVEPLPCNPRGLMRLVNNRRNIVESMRRLKNNADIDSADLSELTQRLTSIIRTDTDWDKNIQGLRGRLRMFKNPHIMRVTEASNIDLSAAMHKPTVLIFGAPASLGPDAESLAACFVYQMQQKLHTRYGTKSVLPLFAFFDEYQTLNIDLAGRLSAIVRGANGGLTVILQNISQIASGSKDPLTGSSELKTIFSNSAVRVCLHNADETTAKFFSDEMGKHAVVVPGIADHYQANGFGIFPTSWNRIHSQQVVARVDTDSIKRMEKQHALVYLSPAGDPEFGETKPLMVDLRGIEEIARLHLLHNVTARKQQELAGAGSAPNGAPGGGGNGGAPAPISGSGMPSFAQPARQAQAAFAEEAVQGHLIDHNAQPVQQPQALPQFGQPQVQPAAQAQQAQVPSQPVVTPNGTRICQHCARPAGKGKFCIECGQFIGASAPAQEAPAAQPQAIPQVQQPTMPQFGQPQQPSVPQFGQPAQAPAGTAVAAVAQVEAPVQADVLMNPAQAAQQYGMMDQQANAPAPRIGGLAVQNRGALPSKRSALFESASEIANAAQQAFGSGYDPGQTAQPQQPQQFNPNQQRKPVTSLSPDASRFGGVQGKAPGGVEF